MDIEATREAVLAELVPIAREAMAKRGLTAAEAAAVATRTGVGGAVLKDARDHGIHVTEAEIARTLI